LFNLSTAILVSVIWGLSLLVIFSFRLAREQKAKPWRVVFEHLLVAIVVIIITHYLGDWISSRLG
jgi:VIT1/CCC1 family predicted Fe2+/Mn2+ transporter